MITDIDTEISLLEQRLAWLKQVKELRSRPLSPTQCLQAQAAAQSGMAGMDVLPPEPYWPYNYLMPLIFI